MFNNFNVFKMGDISILFVSGIGMVMHLLDIFTVFWVGDILNESVRMTLRFLSKIFIDLLLLFCRL